MKKALVLILPICLLFIRAVFSQDKTTIAVSELSGKGISAMEASIVSDFIREAIVNTQVFSLVERSSMEQILSEQKFQLSGCTTDECAVKMGKLLNVRKIMTGSVSKLGTKYYISMRMVDVQSGLIDKAETVSADSIDDIQPACVNLANMFATGKKPVSRKRVAKSKSTKKAVVSADSEPSGADLYIDEEFIGKTPQEVELDPGRHKIKIQKDSAIWEKTVYLYARMTKKINAKLKTAPGKLSITSTPQGAKIYYKGNFVGTTPFSRKYKSGTYNIKLKKRNYKPYEMTVEVKAGETTEKSAVLEKIKKHQDIEITKDSRVKLPFKKRVFAIGLGASGLSAKLQLKALALEAKAVSGDDILAPGGRFYLNLNPSSRSVIYLGGEFSVITGKSEIQEFTGTSAGGFLGMEIFFKRHFSFFSDIGSYNIALDSQYEGVSIASSFIVANLGFYIYF